MSNIATKSENNSAKEIFNKAIAILDIGENWLNKNYLSDLEKYKVKDFDEKQLLKLGISDVSLFRLERINLENKQSMLESLTSTYYALGTQGYTVFLLLDCKNNVTQLYLGVKKSKGQGKEGGDLLNAVLKGHFAGSQYTKEAKPSEILELLSPELDFYRSVTSLTSVPSLALDEREHFMQGLEKFIDAAEQQDFQALFLAEPVSLIDLNSAEKQYANIATQLSPLIKQQLSFNDTATQSIGESISNAITESLTQTETTGTSITLTVNESKTNSINLGGGINIGHPKVGINLNGGLGKASAYGVAKAEGENSSSAVGRSKGETKTLGQNIGFSESTSRNVAFDTLNKGIERVMQLVDTHLERIQEAKSYGGWLTATYFISQTKSQSQALASIYLGLMRGEKSHTEIATFSTWRDEDAKAIFKWLRNLTHPCFHSDWYDNDITPATLVSGKEMAVQLGFPRCSTSTVSVVETLPFGRSIQTTGTEKERPEKSVHLGTIYHLWQDTKLAVNLDVKKLSSHLFVTGSTGSGKSNTVYQLLNELDQHKIPFMVIEPAKGEYKHVFGHYEDVSVFGTNPLQAQLLKINPFKFPNGIHVLEHIDRLIEIFNVCWPMYAAMPAILKDAMLNAYETSGWDLTTSCNSVSDSLFPSFIDLLGALEKVINSSAYSDEMKSNYIGSLVTRVRSLTNGLNGQIFSANEIDNTVLFDSKVIIDLSRVGSQETKSLIMGILVMRLSEHRMSNADGMNQPLKHVTVLEEAHNILKRTSTEQSSEGSNVAGKAVEMLSNAIAEMRTYGEGFIIADQSPSAVDISAIRNTNTKIIMRLPDEADRQLAGKSAGVKDEQLEEIAKLAKGVAVVYQNDWLEPVLCNIHHFNSDEKQYEYKPVNELEMTKKAFNQHMADLLFSKKTNKRLDFTEISQSIRQSQLGVEYKNYFLEVVNRLEQNVVSPILEKDDAYLMDLYQRIIQQHIDRVNVDLSVEVQKHLANIM
ncbi:hypothetical protein BKG94_05585 [Rodentibacter ratti]|uniref:ATP-binding protein n=1 Tax=Rodentibacter ratti TaxID=1906745 RepID=UPI000985019F|nr:ATP-binding protein [Rodentibacter ratti]OOF88613.1 hypothetical protein BKG94_05585 [Rodentibacter ratti]